MTSTETPWFKRIPWPLVIIFLVTLATRVWFVNNAFTEEAFTKWMPYHFDTRALAILFGERHQLVTGWASYPILLAGLYWIFDLFGALAQRYYLIALFNSLLASVSVCLVYLIARRVLRGENPLYVYLVTFLYLVYYPSVYFTILNVSENPFTPLVLLLVYLTITTEKFTWRSGFVAGTLFSLATVIRPILIPFLPFFLGWLIYQHRADWRRFIKAYCPAFFGIFAAIVLAVSYVNSQHDDKGYFHFTGNSGANVAIAWCQPKKLGNTFNGRRMWFSHPTLHPRWDLTNIETTVPFVNHGYYYKMALNCLREQPWRIITNVEHIFATFDGKLYPDYLLYRWHHRLLDFWKIYTIPLLLGFFLYPWVYRGQLTGKYWGLGAGLFGSLLLAMYVASSGEERYLFPYFFALIVWGAPALLTGAKQILLVQPGKRWLIWGLVIGLAASSPWVYRWSIHQYDQWEFNRAYLNSTRWLINNQKEDGSFEYQVRVHNPLALLKGNNFSRQILTIMGMANAARSFDLPDVQESYQQGIAYLKAHTEYDGNRAYISPKKDFPDNPVSIHATNYGVMAYLDSPTPEAFRGDIEKLGEFILSMQEDSGRFQMLYPSHLNQSLDDEQELYRQKFGSGGAGLACGKLYEFTQDKRYLTCARKTNEYYYPILTSMDFDRHYASWHALAYAKLYQIEPEETRRKLLLDQLNYLGKRYLRMQNQHEFKKQLLGGFDGRGDVPTSSEAVYTEILGVIARMNQLAGNEKQAQKLIEGNRLGIKNLLRFQLGMHHGERLGGGIRNNEASAVIRVDNNGHALITFYEYFNRP